MSIYDVDFNEVRRLSMVWASMRRRCSDTATGSARDNYFGRGIRVEPVWEDFHTFCCWALANGAAPGLHLDRINNDGPYGPANCRFVSPTVNGRNKRTNRLVTAFGESRPLSAWAEDPRCVVTEDALRLRLSRFGWEPEAAITTPAKGLRSTCNSGHPWVDGSFRWQAPGRRLCLICRRDNRRERTRARRAS